MSDREKLIELLWTHPCAGIDCATCERLVEADCDTAALADKLLANGVTFATDSKWISAEDRLPEQTLRCLVYQKSPFKYEGLVSIATFTTSFRGLRGDPMNGKQVWYKYDYLCGDCVIDDITHWMPLPEPPKN